MSDAQAPALPRIRSLRKPDKPRRGSKLAWVVDHRAQILASIAIAALMAGSLPYTVDEGDAGQTVWRATVAGYLPPIGGAPFQEIIDLAVILNALRALRG